jgi:hypothetical protein
MLRCTLSTLMAALVRQRAGHLSVVLIFALCAGTLLTPLVAQHRAASKPTRNEAVVSGKTVQADDSAATQTVLKSPQEPRTISGVKWLDLNRNGRREADEPGLPGWTIELNSVRTRGYRKTTTDAAGNFKFEQRLHCERSASAGLGPDLSQGGGANGDGAGARH